MVKRLLAWLYRDEWPYLLPDVGRSLVVAYVLWLLWGMFGVHKFYLGRPVLGFVYLLTGGLLGLGWLYDLFTLPWQVRAYHLRRMGEAALRGRPGDAASGAGTVTQRLLRAAESHGGYLSVTDGVLATGLPFAKVEAALRGMVASGYVDVRNHPDSGVVQYVFPELVGGGRPRDGSR